MSEPGFASLGPTLLARKGGAKPAMRPQLAPLVRDEHSVDDEHLQDLGWNDMGEHAAEGGADIVPINAGVGLGGSADDFGQGSGPVVRRQQRGLEERVLAEAVMTGPDDREPEYDAEDEAFYGEDYAAPSYDEQAGDVPVFVQSGRTAQVAASKQRVSAVQAGRRAAFTLRLDVDRHLKLRLAATMQGVSAQVLVTEALDRLLSEFDDLDVIAKHLKRH